MSATSSPAFNLTSTLGAYEIGVLISMALFGFVTVQTFTYYKNFPNDRWYIKLFVGIVWIMEVAHTILTAHSLYWISVVQYGQPEFILEFTSSLIASVAFSAIIGPIVQAFFANRIRTLSSKLLIPCICWILSSLRCISLFALTAVLCTDRGMLEFRKKWTWLMVTTLAISTALDVIIGASMCYYLYHRRQHAFKGTKRIVDKLIIWTIQTGLVTSIASITMLITLLAGENFIWVAIFFIISRLFSNSLMASLNARDSLGELGTTVNFLGDSSYQLHSTNTQHINVNVSRITDQWEEPNESGKPHMVD